MFANKFDFSCVSIVVDMSDVCTAVLDSVPAKIALSSSILEY